MSDVIGFAVVGEDFASFPKDDPSFFEDTSSSQLELMLLPPDFSENVSLKLSIGPSSISSVSSLDTFSLQNE